MMDFRSIHRWQSNLQMLWTSFCFIVLLNRVQGDWSPDASARPASMPTLTSLDVTCYKHHMTVTAEFSNSFYGTVFSKGNSGQEGCVYVAAHSGQKRFQFNIQYDRCGTKPDLNGKLYENTIVVQYGTDLIEVWDEAKRLRCEWFNDYQKTQAANPPVLIDDLEEVQQEFVGDHIEVWMEIQEGKGPWASQVSGIVPLGSTLTLVVAINDSSHEFDMLVRSCVASDGVRQPLLLSDELGCIMRPKMFGPFQKIRVHDGRASMITYAHFQAFKFPDALSVQMQCRVMICRHGCPDHCQKNNGNSIQAQKRVDTGSDRLLMPSEANSSMPDLSGSHDPSLPPVGPRNLRIKRSEVTSLDHEYAVTQLFQAVSRTDLAFAPSFSDNIDILSGHAAQDGVLCLPTLPFTLLIIIVSSLAILAVGVAAVVAYRYFSRLPKPHVKTICAVTQQSRSKIN